MEDQIEINEGLKDFLRLQLRLAKNEYTITLIESDFEGDSEDITDTEGARALKRLCEKEGLPEGMHVIWRKFTGSVGLDMWHTRDEDGNYENTDQSVVGGYYNLQKVF